MLDRMLTAGRASFILGGQWGSEGKGASAAFVAAQLAGKGRMFDIVTTNAGAQAGHTSVHNEKKRVAYHLPTAALIAADYVKAGKLASLPMIYLNAGSIINPEILEQELADAGFGQQSNFFIHPNAAVITEEDIASEGAPNSAQTAIASTRKGVGTALANKILRRSKTAKDHPFLRQFVAPTDLNVHCAQGQSVLVEVPQGIGLSIDGPFYPYCTSRNCTIMQAMSDAGLHPDFFGMSMLVMRTYPIRVGNIIDNVGLHTDGTPLLKELGQSGGCYADQKEISWNQLKVPPEITTVTKRIRRVFTFSHIQLMDAMRLTRPNIVHLTFCDYPELIPGYIRNIVLNVSTFAQRLNIGSPQMLYQYGPSTGDTVYKLFKKEASCD